MTPPDGIDCTRAVDHLYEYLDGELTPADEASVRAHLEACAPCFAHFGFERSFVKFVEARTRARSAPEDVRRRILHEVFDAGASGHE